MPVADLGDRRLNCRIDGAPDGPAVGFLNALGTGARFKLMRGFGHLPCVEAPERCGALLTGFLRQIGHIQD